MIVAGIDAGTQSIKVLIYDSEKHEIMALSSSPLPLIEDEGGIREQKASWWIDALRKSFWKIKEEIREKIEVIAVSGQQHGFVPVSIDKGVLCNVKLWCDTSTARECIELEDKAGGREKLAKRLGNPILPGYTASKILWLYKKHRELYDEMDYVLLPHDYLNWYLTGEMTMERGDASGTGVMNIFSSNWDEEALALIAPDLIDKMPKISQKPGIIGSIRKSTAEELGLSQSCLVSSGGGDNMMSAIGTGSVSDGILTMSLGTSGTLFASSSKAFYDEKHRLASFCSSTGTYLPLLCTMNCTVATETIRRLFSIEVRDIDEIASSSLPGSEGIMLLPFFNGERVPDYPHGEGVLFGMRQSNVKKENIMRAAMEGVTYEFLLGLDAFRENGIAVKELILTGGGAKSRLWRKIVSDMTLCPVKVPKTSESAAFGTALHGLWCKEGGKIEELVKNHVEYDDEKAVNPDAKDNEIYKAGYIRWLEYSKTLSPIFR